MIMSINLIFPADQIEVRATYYNPSIGQGVGNSLVTADGSRIDKIKLKSGQLRWVALSRDLLNSRFSFGDTIFIICDDPFFRGKWIVKDKMGRKPRMGIDFLLPKGSIHKPPYKVKIIKYERNIHD